MTVHPRPLDYPQSFLSSVIPDEAELTAGQRVEPGRSYEVLYRHDIVHRL
jgi:formate dehydrogenase iron-sulfur subunit